MVEPGERWFGGRAGRAPASPCRDPGRATSLTHSGATPHPRASSGRSPYLPSISARRLARPQFWICFSRANAAAMCSCSSNQTSLPVAGSACSRHRAELMLLDAASRRRCSRRSTTRPRTRACRRRACRQPRARAGPGTTGGSLPVDGLQEDGSRLRLAALGGLDRRGAEVNLRRGGRGPRCASWVSTPPRCARRARPPKRATGSAIPASTLGGGWGRRGADLGLYRERVCDLCRSA